VAKSKTRAASETGDLAKLSTHALRQRWDELYGTAPLPRISRDVLMRGVAFRIQEEAYGGLAKAHRRQLHRLAENLSGGGSIPASQAQAFKPGTKLIREWKGRVHEVMICDDGYVWGGKRYRSLSRIARSITGTRWSGPRFFGLESECRPATPATAKRDARLHARSSSLDAGGAGDG
jgi:hypothetical protein